MEKNSNKNIIDKQPIPVATVVEDPLYKKCRGCDRIFMYNNTSQYSAEHYRCEECRSTRGLVRNIINSCLIM